MYSFPNPQTSPTKLEIQTLETCLLPVIAEMVFATESLHTGRADERTFIGVSSDVNLEVVRLGELSITETADVLRRAGPPTHPTTVQLHHQQAYTQEQF